jgi:ferric-dicitrate binding protein FerR (iron transport regulator)
MTWLDRHLDEQALLRFHYHQLESETYQRLVAHLEECVACRRELDQLEQHLAQSPAPELESVAAGRERCATRARRQRRRRRLRRGAWLLALLLLAAGVLIARNPAWQPLRLSRQVPAQRPPASAAPQPFDLPLDGSWLQRYLPAAGAAAPD